MEGRAASYNNNNNNNVETDMANGVPISLEIEQCKILFFLLVVVVITKDQKQCSRNSFPIS